MNCVLVIEKDGEVRQRVPYDAQEDTIVFLYDKESRVIWESLEGRYYTDSIPYETKRLFYEPRFVEMCKKYGATVGRWKEEKEKEELSFENIHLKGLQIFEDKDVFGLCSREVRETNYAEDRFLLHLCFEMFKRGQYDKVILTYLANFYCGATADMKELWKVLREYKIPSYKIAERIITQMLFAEHLFAEEKIFEDYYLGDNVYFRLKQAYLAYVAKQYVVEGRIVDAIVFEIIANECDKKEELADICKIALLKYYSEREYYSEMEPVIHKCMREMCEKQMVFPFFQNYKESWLRELQIYNKSMICYQATPGSKVTLCYKMKKSGREELGYHTVPMLPVYENIYVKQFILFEEEEIVYYFQELSGDETITTDKMRLENQKSDAGQYGRINAMIKMAPASRKMAMAEYAQEERLAERLFKMY